MYDMVYHSKRLSSNIYQIIQHINTTNHKIHSDDQIRKMIVNLGSKKGDKNDDTSPKIMDQHNDLLLDIVETPERDVSHGEGNSHTRKVGTSSVKLSS